MALKITGVSDEFVIDEVIAFAIEGMSRLPSAYRPAGKISDLKDILSEMPHAELALLLHAAATIYYSACRPRLQLEAA